MPKEIKFTTSAKEAGEVVRSLELTFLVGETLAEDEEIFGTDVVKQIFNAQAVIKAQNYVRQRLAAKNEDGSWKYPDEEIFESFASWELTGGNRTTKSKAEKALDLMSDMTVEQIQELIAKHKARQEGVED